MSESMQFINASGEVVGEISFPQSGFAPNAVNGSTCECCNEVDRLSDAIAAVLELHKEVGSWRSGVYQCGQCAELCHSTSGLGCEDPIDAVWPCPTVVAIQSALGEGEK